MLPVKAGSFLPALFCCITIAKIMIQYLLPKFKKLGISNKDINKQIEATKINILAVAIKIKLITLKEVKTI